MSFIIGQIISVFSLVISLVITQFKNVKYVLLGEIAANITIALSYIFLGGLSGGWVCIVATIQTIIVYLANTQDIPESKRRLLPLVFAAVYMASTIIVYQSWRDIISCSCAILYILAIIQKSTKKYRQFMVTNSLMWILYDISTNAYVNLLTHGLMLVSLFIAIIRLDRKNEGMK